MKRYMYDGKANVPKDVIHVTVSSSVLEIPCAAFKDCEKLESIKLPLSLFCIGYSAFYGCHKLTKVVIPSSVISIGDDAFFGCFGLENINLPEGLSSIGDNVFQQCVSLPKITLPQSLERLGGRTGGAFYQCCSLQEIMIPPLITVILRGTFSCCSRLENVTLAPSVKELGKDSFASCGLLKYIDLPATVEKIHPTAFRECMSLKIDKITLPSAFTNKGGNDPFSILRSEPYHVSNLSNFKDSNVQLKPGPDPQVEFGGKTQRGWGPEWCGISLEQLIDIKKHPFYHRLGRNGQPDYKMREFVQDLIAPMTEGAGMSYALLHNQERPLKVKTMVSHVWDELLKEFVDGIERSGEEGPFWVCAFSIYQNEDQSKGVTIPEQIGCGFDHGPFATVLKISESIILVPTNGCNVYTRLWIVFETFYATQNGMRIQLHTQIPPDDLYMGRTQKDICVVESMHCVGSINARCGAPGSPVNDDEIAIRNEINSSDLGFDLLDEVIDRIRLENLVTYPLYHTVYGKTAARDHIKSAIEEIISRLPTNEKLKPFHIFLKEKGVTGARPLDIESGDVRNDYAKNKIDMFDKWLGDIRDVIQPYSHLYLPNINNSSIRLKEGPGPTKGFQGQTQRGYGPEWWGVSLEQIQKLKLHPKYYQVDENGRPNYTMKDFDKDMIRPSTDGTGIGYALFHNQDNPLKVETMVSHAWDESIQEFVEAIERSGEEGPFWICTLAMYQNDDESKGVTIKQQLGDDPKHGPFATVLNHVDHMMAVLTNLCDIYTRLWCAYEMFTATQCKVRVHLCPHINPDDLYMGRTNKDICVAEAKKPVVSKKARCGHPDNSVNDDEKAIRKQIESTCGKFDEVNRTVEIIRLKYLLNYPLQLGCRKTTARDHIKDAIEAIIDRLPSNTDLISFDKFLLEKHKFHPGFNCVTRSEDFDDTYSVEDHLYYVANGGKGDTVDVFEEWMHTLRAAIRNSSIFCTSYS